MDALRKRPELQLLTEAPDFRLLLLARLFSGIGTWLAFFALIVLVYERTGSAHWVSALVVADLLPAAVVGLALGYVVDRYSRRGVMIVSDLIGFEIFVLLPLVASTGGLIALTAVAAAAAAFFRPAAYAAVPNLVDERRLVHANALMQSAENVTTVAAPLIGGLIVATAGADIAFWANAGSFLVSAGLVWLIPSERLHAQEAAVSEPGSALGEIRRGFALMRETPVLRTIFFSWAVVTVVFGLLNVTEVILVKEAYGAGDLGFGIFVAATAGGLVVGNVAAPSLIDRIGTRRAYAVGFAVMTAGVLGAAVVEAITPGIVASALLGLGNGFALVVNLTLLQRALPDSVRGRAFAFMGGVVAAAMLVGMIAAAPLAESIGVRATWMIAAGALAGAGVFVLVARSLHHGGAQVADDPADASVVKPAIGDGAEAAAEWSELDGSDLANESAAEPARVVTAEPATAVAADHSIQASSRSG